MSKIYTHKATEVEAIQLTPESFDECVEFIGADNTGDDTVKSDCHINLVSEEGERSIKEGDYIIKGVLGKVYPCSAEVFEASYEVKA